jgi:hypothetical protein
MHAFFLSIELLAWNLHRCGLAAHSHGSQSRDTRLLSQVGMQFEYQCGMALPGQSKYSVILHVHWAILNVFTLHTHKTHL